MSAHPMTSPSQSGVRPRATSASMMRQQSCRPSVMSRCAASSPCGERPPWAAVLRNPYRRRSKSAMARRSSGSPPSNSVPRTLNRYPSSPGCAPGPANNAASSAMPRSMARSWSHACMKTRRGGVQVPSEDRRGAFRLHRGTPEHLGRDERYRVLRVHALAGTASRRSGCPSCLRTRAAIALFEDVGSSDGKHGSVK